MSKDCQTKVICNEYQKLKYGQDNRNSVSGIVTIEYENLPVDAKAAMLASIAYTIDMVNAGEL
jgi:hypothetical protein